MIIKTASLIKKIILAIFFSILLIVFSFYGLLVDGITLKDIYFYPLIIKKLYLKLDKKLIVEGENIVVLTQQKKQKQNFPLYLQVVELLPKLFQQISLKNIFIANRFYDINYHNNLLTITNSKFTLICSLTKEHNYINMDIQKFFYKPYNFSLQAQGSISLNAIQFKGKYNFEGIKGKFALLNHDSNYLLYATSKEFKRGELKKAFSHFRLHPDIKKWSYENIKAQSYKLQSLKIYYDANKKFSANNIEAVAIAKGVKVSFHPQLPAASIQKVILHYANDTLFFNLFHPTYKNKNLKGSSVIIKHLTNPSKSYINIVLKTKTPFDATMQRVLRTYKVDLPIIQKSGSIDAKVAIRIYFISGDINIRGDFIFYNSYLLINDTPLYTPKSILLLRNQKLIFRKSAMQFFNLFFTHTQGWIDLQKNRGEFIVHIDRAKLQKDGVTLLDIKNTTDHITLDLLKKRLISRHFTLEASFENNKTITIHNINKLLPYSTLLQKISPFQGDLQLSFIDKDTISFQSKLFKQNSLLFHHNRAITHFLIKGKISPKTTSLQINRNISIKIAKNINIVCKNIECNISKESKSLSIPKNIEAALHNVTFIYNDYTFPFHSAFLQLHKNSMTLQGKNHNSFITLNKRDSRFSLLAKKLDADFINHLLKNRLFSGGEFRLQAKGDIKNFTGQFQLFNTHIKNLKAINNLFAFINSIPALVTFHNPGFNKKGLFIKRGSVDFIYNNGIVIIKKLFLESISLNFEGKGVINLYNKSLNMDIKLITFKSITNILNKIPVAGYILLGKEGNAYTTLHLTGNLTNPKITTQLTKETLQLPFKIIKRTLQLPFTIFQ